MNLRIHRAVETQGKCHQKLEAGKPFAPPPQKKKNISDGNAPSQDEAQYETSKINSLQSGEPCGTKSPTPCPPPSLAGV